MESIVNPSVTRLVKQSDIQPYPGESKVEHAANCPPCADKVVHSNKTELQRLRETADGRRPLKRFVMDACEYETTQ